MSQYTIPDVVDRSGGSEMIVDVYSHLLGNRIIYLPRSVRRSRRARPRALRHSGLELG